VVIGGAFGGATGFACQLLFPDLPVQVGAFTLVGMAGFFAGAANTPISTIIMVSEMTGSYDLLLPAMLVCMVSYLMCRRYTLYQKQLVSRMDAPSKLGNMARAILRTVTVQAALDLKPSEKMVTASEDTPIGELAELVQGGTQECFPVLDSGGELTGVIHADDVEALLGESGIADLVIALDVMRKVAAVTPDESLLSAVNRLAADSRGEVLVVDGADTHRLVGSITSADIVKAYNAQILEPTPAAPRSSRGRAQTTGRRASRQE